MPYASLILEFATQTGTAPNNAMQIVERFLEGCESGKLYTFGWILTNGKWQLTRLSQENRRMMYALDYTVRNVLNHQSVLTVRIGRGLPKFGPCPYARISVLTYWKTRFEEAEVFESDPDQTIQTKIVAGSEWPNLKYIQTLIGGEADEPEISDVSEQLELQPMPNYMQPSDDHDSVQHENDDSQTGLAQFRKRTRRRHTW